MTTELVKFDEVIKQSGLAIQEGEEIKQSYLPFAIQLAEIQEQAAKINFEKPTPTDEIIARDLRLRTVKIRTGASDMKDNRKRIHLLKGNLEQAAYNLIAASCKLSEEEFTTVEKAREIAESKRRAELKIIRDAEVLSLAEFVPFGMDLGKFSEEDYQKLLLGAKMQMEQKREQERKEEEVRQAEIAEQKRIREDNDRLQKQIENERKAAEEKAWIEREASEAKLKEEREARAKAEAEIKAKADQERKVAEEKALAEKKAKSAPDKQKLIALASVISGMTLPEMKTIEGMVILDNVKELLKKTSEFITKKVGEI